MGIKDLFDEQRAAKLGQKDSVETLGSKVESDALIDTREADRLRFIPPIDFSTASNFAKYGSAEQYYRDAVDRVANQWPYDGSKAERQQFTNNSTYIDLYVLEHRYPTTTGYAHVSHAGWGDLSGSKVGEYGQPETLEYIQIIGGPHSASSGMIGKSIHSMFSKANLYDNDVTGSGTRESNLHMNLSGGMSLEFWMKKDDFISTSLSDREVIFDLWNSVVTSSGGTDNQDYGRFTLELDSGESNSPFKFTLMSGTNGVSDQTIASSGIAKATVIDNSWHHYAFTFQNTGSVLEVKSFVDGGLVGTDTHSVTQITEITGGLIANIGALRAAPSGTAYNGVTTGIRGASFEGAAKLSGALDEFRFWKSKRTESDIGLNYFTNIGGGTNSDLANTTLGFYFKFNEGITETGSIDSKVLDYSGRVSNGNWVGYPGLAARDTGSAIVSASAALFEEEDYIIYPDHPKVRSLKTELVATGSLWDLENQASIYWSLPGWITEEDREGSEDLLKLTQIISSYFDMLHMQIEHLPHLKDKTYTSGSDKPAPFSNRLLTSVGFQAPEIFIESNVLNAIAHRDDSRNFEEKIHDVKNLIYKNIYNNLDYIVKSKGTEKSIRNLIRCFGVDEELVRLNLYSDGVTYKFRDNFRSTVVKKNYADFNNTDRFDATIYQQTGSDGEGRSFITGSLASGSLGMTVEAEVIFPVKYKYDNPNYFDTYFLTASLFGMHTADPTTPTDFTYGGGTHRLDSANFQVYAVRDELESDRVYFKLTSSNPYPIPLLTSSYYHDTYDDQKWNFAVRIKPTKHLRRDVVTGSANTGVTGHSPEKGTFDIEFYGVNNELEIVQNEFIASGTLTNAVGTAFMAASKRLYVGAHRQNFTASVSDYQNVVADAHTDVQISSLRYWQNYLENDVIKAHARDIVNVGTKNPFRSSYGAVHYLTGTIVPEIETLALHWDFTELSSSSQYADHIGPAGGANAGFWVTDMSSGSSGSAASDTYSSPRLGWLSEVTKIQHPGRASYYNPSDSGSISHEYVLSARQILPELQNSSDMVKIMREDDIQFDKDSRPIHQFFALEKSMYATISEQMLNMFATMAEFNNLIGQPAERYRPKYKELEKLKELFFEKVGNTPDLDKYIDYYKWIDHSLSIFVRQLVPLSANFSSGVRTVVESHLLERSKYQTKFPTLEMKVDDPETGMVSVNKHLYNWRYGHHPVGGKQSDNCTYWNERAERQHQGSLLSSSEGTVNTSRKMILSASTQVLKRKWTTPFRFTVDEVEEYRGGTNYRKNKKLDMVRQATQRHGRVHYPVHVPANIMTIDDLEVYGLKDCDDVSMPNEKKFYTYSVTLQKNLPPHTHGPTLSEYQKVIKGDLASPFTLVSASIKTGYNNYVFHNFHSGAMITNVHSDTYGPDNEEPLQGPFTRQWVGGRQHRHIKLNDHRSLDNAITRPEAWKILLGPTVEGAADSGSISGAVDARFLGIVGPDYPHPSHLIPDSAPYYPVTASQHAVYYRDELAKRPLNIKNIMQTTASLSSSLSGTIAHGRIGNYSKNYQVVQTHGRSTNPRYIRDASGSVLPSMFTKQRTEDDPRDGGFQSLPATTHPLTLISILPYNQGIGAVWGNAGASLRYIDVDGKGLRGETLSNDLKPRTGFTGSANVMALPNRTKQDSVFVNRFSAPGGPEVQSRGYLDVAAEEFSVHNSLNYRNLAIRGSSSGDSVSNHANRGQHIRNSQHKGDTKGEGLQTKYRRHAGLHGIDSQYGSVLESARNSVHYEIVTASYHKINRNAQKINIYTADDYGSMSPYPLAGDEGVSLDKLATRTQYDNWFVQHPIPRSDLQYAWISTSYTSSTCHGHPTGSGEITFASSSDIGSFSKTGGARQAFASGIEIAAAVSDGHINAHVGQPEYVDFVGMNNLINEPISGNCNTIGYPSNYHIRAYANMADTDSQTHVGQNATFGASNVVQLGEPDPTSATETNRQGYSAVLNALILHRQGPYGWPSWKQIRGYEHPIARHHRRNNIYSLPTEVTEKRDESDGTLRVYTSAEGMEDRLQQTSRDTSVTKANFQAASPATTGFTGKGSGYKAGVYTNFTESCVSAFGRPMTTIIGDSAVQHSYANNLSTFTTPEIADRLGSQISDQVQGQMYNRLHDTYKGGDVEFGLAYSERVFPASKNAWVQRNRIRNNFDCHFWRPTREARQITSGSTSQMAFRNRAAYPGPNTGVTSNHTGSEFVQQAFKYDKISMWPLDARPDIATSKIEGPVIVTGQPLGAVNSHNFHYAPDSQKTDLGLQLYDPATGSLESVGYIMNLSGNFGGELMNCAIQFSSSAGRISGSHQSYLGPNAHQPGTNSTTITFTLPGFSLFGDAGTITLTSFAEFEPDHKLSQKIHIPHAMYTRRHCISTASSLDQESSAMPLVVAKNIFGIRGKAKYLASDQMFGGEAEWVAAAQANKFPFFSSYEEWASPLRLKAKDYTLVPEFRISEHMDYYMTKKNGNFLSANPGLFTLTGSAISSSLDEQFYTVYSNADFMKHFEVLDEDHKNVTDGPSQVSLKCKAFLKFMPYDGFYPALRTVQLANLLSASYKPYVNSSIRQAGIDLGNTEEQNIWSIFMTPFFAPGLLYNSIKSGIAVDFPIYTKAFDVVESRGLMSLSASYGTDDAALDQFGRSREPSSSVPGPNSNASNGVAQTGQHLDTLHFVWATEDASDNPHKQTYPGATGSAYVAGMYNRTGAGLSGSNTTVPISSSFLYDAPRQEKLLDSSFNKRIPFEALVSPEKYLKDVTIKWMEPHLSASMTGAFGHDRDGGAIWSGDGDDRYKMAMNNFLAEVPEFFLEGGNFSSIVSLPENDPNFGVAEKGKTYAAMVRIRKSMESTAGKSIGNRHKFGYPTPWKQGTGNMTMYNRASSFGPPWRSQALFGYRTPFTPPYYDGEAWAILRFTGSDFGDGYDGTLNPFPQQNKYTLDEIMNSTTVEYVRCAYTASYHHAPSGSGWTGSVATVDETARDAFFAHLTSSRDIGADGDNSDTVENHLIDPKWYWVTGSKLSHDSLNETNSMQVSASLNLFRKAEIKSVTYDAVTGAPQTVSDDNDANLKVWIIQPKFETPILNFTNQFTDPAGAAADLPFYGSGSTSIGMWHQYGVLPEDDSVGIFMEIMDVPEEFILSSSTGLGEAPYYGTTDKSVQTVGLGDPQQMRFPFTSAQTNRRYLGLQRTGSLCELVGFPTTPVKLGKTASAKKVSEAIVAVPFIEKNTERMFFHIERETIDKAEAELAGGGAYSLANQANEPGETIVNMINSMKKFVIPPKMDFLTNRDVTPFAMYVFEFEHEFKQKDLTDIWQNLPPDSMERFAQKTVTISHELLATELMGQAGDISGQKLQNHLQWMVFKVKQKANKSYSSKIAGEATEEQEQGGVFSSALRAGFKYNFNLTSGEGVNSTQTVPTYSYNWPYDYFSLVELAQIESTVTYGDIAIPGSTPISRLAQMGKINALAAGVVPVSSAGCVREGTIIKTDRGDIPVEEVLMSDKVYGYQIDDDELNFFELVDIFSFITPSWCRIKTNSGKELECSVSHNFVKRGNETNKITASDINIGSEILINEDGQLVIDTVAEIEVIEEPVKVWNFTVDKAHTYFSNGMLSHNAAAASGASGATYSSGAGRVSGGNMQLNQSANVAASSPTTTGMTTTGLQTAGASGNLQNQTVASGGAYSMIASGGLTTGVTTSKTSTASRISSNISTLKTPSSLRGI